MLELTVAAAMMAVLLATSVQMLRVISGQQRAAERRALALRAVQAVAEQLENAPWDQLTSESAKQASIPHQVETYFPGAKLTATVVEEPIPLTSKRIMIEFTWTGPDGRAVAPARLTAWAYPDASSPQ